MPLDVDEQRLDDPTALAELDPSGMLRAVATAGAQIRESCTSAEAAGLQRVAEEGRPRAVLLCGMGGSGIAGEALAAVLGFDVPVPVLVHRDEQLPGWVGAADLVVGVSCSGTTRETLHCVQQAHRRNARLVGVGSADSPLDELVTTGHGVFLPVRPVLAPRASTWALLTPLLMLGDRLGLLQLGSASADGEPPELLEAAAARLEQIAISCRPDNESFVNPAKDLALSLLDSQPMVWGSGRVGPVAALRLVCQLAENAKQQAVFGALPEALHNLVVTFDRPQGDVDLFRDRVSDTAATAPRLVLLRDDPALDDDQSTGASHRVDTVQRLAEDRGLQVTVLAADGEGPVERLASLVALADFASVYLALLRGIDPTPIRAIEELKASTG